MFRFIGDEEVASMGCFFSGIATVVLTAHAAVTYLRDGYSSPITGSVLYSGGYPEIYSWWIFTALDNWLYNCPLFLITGAIFVILAAFWCHVS